MRVLEFDVEQQVLKKTPRCDFSNIVAGSVGYLKAKFHFLTTEWDNCVRVANFSVDNKEYAVKLDKDNSCEIPAEVLGGPTFFVEVHGAKPMYRIKSTKFKVKQKQEVN